MICHFQPDPLKDAPLEAIGKINVGENFDMDKPIILGMGLLPNESVTLEGGEQFIVSVRGDELILELRNNK